MSKIINDTNCNNEIKLEFYIDNDDKHYIYIKNIYKNNYVDELLTLDYNIYFKNKLCYVNLYQVLNLDVLLEFLYSSKYNSKNLFILNLLDYKNLSKYKEENKQNIEDKLIKSLKLINDLYKHIQQIVIIIDKDIVETLLTKYNLYKKYEINSKIFYTFVNKYI